MSVANKQVDIASPNIWKDAFANNPQSNAIVKQTTARKLSILETIPNEVLLLLFETLKPTSSACLGLTCRKLYPIHRALHGTVSVKSKVLYRPYVSRDYIYLYDLLDEWVDPTLTYFKPFGKFATKEQILNYMEQFLANYEMTGMMPREYEIYRKFVLGMPH